VKLAGLTLSSFGCFLSCFAYCQQSPFCGRLVGLMMAGMTGMAVISFCGLETLEVLRTHYEQLDRNKEEIFQMVIARRSCYSAW
jgi:hypothetical protein